MAVLRVAVKTPHLFDDPLFGEHPAPGLDQHFQKLAFL